MTRQKLAIFVLLLGTLGACGSRSALNLGHSSAVDGGGDSGRDGGGDGLGSPDGLIIADAVTADVQRLDGPGLDSLPTDVVVQPDTRPADLATPDLRADTNPGIDTNRPDGNTVVTLSSIELAPPVATIVAGVAYSEFVVTAVMSDGTTTDVTSDATFASGDTSLATVSGHTVTGLKAGVVSITATYKTKTVTATVTVTSSPLQSISIDGVAPVTVGQSILLTATGIFANGTKQDISAVATWTSSDNTLAKVAVDSATGQAKVQGFAAGTVTISASFQGVSAKSDVTVTAASLKRIDITPAQINLQRGLSQTFQATGTYDDGTVGDLTSQATWATSNNAIATVTSDPSGVTVKAVGAGTATISATLGNIGGKASVTVTTPNLIAIKVTPATWSPNVGGTQAFTAMGGYDDGTTADITLSATWSSANPTTVSISNAAGEKGQATALAAGNTQIQASLAGQVASALVTVSASPLVSIDISPSPLYLVVGLKASLVAMGTYQNGTKQDLTSMVAWTTSDSKIATVSNAADTTGQVTGVAIGPTTIIAVYGAIAGKVPVTVSNATLSGIDIQPVTSSIAAGNTQQFTAIGYFDNGNKADITTQVTWTSSTITVAEVSNAAGNNGLASGLVAGNATIYASMSGVQGKATLTVTAPQLSSIMVTPTSANIAVKGTANLTVTAVYQNGTTAPVAGTWSSSDTRIATVAAAAGGRRGATVTGVSAGSATITATYQGKTDTALITVTAAATVVGLTVTPSNPASILVGATQPFQANAVYSDGTTTNVTNTASWTSSDAKVASVSNTAGGGGPGAPGGGRGMATGIGAGTTTITATYSGFSATASLTVRAASPVALLVTPETASIRINGTQQYTALVSLDDGTTQTVTNSASWTTSRGTVASITSNGGGGGFPGGGGGRGLATGLSAGTVTVTATYSGFTATATLTVTAAQPNGLLITPPAPTIQVGQNQALTAMITYDDGTTATATSATWSSSAPSIATVSTAGGGGPGGPGNGGTSVTAISVGNASVTATYSGLSATAAITVTDPSLAYIQVTPFIANLPVDGSAQFTATAVYADNSVRNVTASATWSSSAPSVAVVTSTGGNLGRVSAMSTGTATITASYGGQSASAVLTVATVKSISVTPASPATVLGLPVTFTATAILSNNATVSLGNQASWTTSTPAVATVTAAGVATPLKVGTVTITATFQGKSGSGTLTVSPATLTAIAITPNPLSLQAGATQQLTATGTYSDTTTHDLTAVATWQSSASVVAMVSNAAGSRGQITALGSGNTSVTAVFQGVTSTAAAVTVTP